MADERIQLAFDLLAQHLAEDEVVTRLVSAGCPEPQACRLVAFVPLACARAWLAGKGIAFSPMYRGTHEDGTLGEPQPLAADLVWNAVAAFVRRALDMQADAVFQVALYSAEFKGINQAANAGAPLAELEVLDPVLAFVRPDVAPPRGPPAAPPPWWAFWRR